MRLNYHITMVEFSANVHILIKDHNLSVCGSSITSILRKATEFP